MRTNIEIDDRLMSDVLAAGPFKTKKEAVEAGLRLLVQRAAARELLKLEGKLQWGWDENEERLNGLPNWSQVEPALKARSSKAETGRPATKARKEAR